MALFPVSVVGKEDVSTKKKRSGWPRVPSATPHVKQNGSGHEGTPQIIFVFNLLRPSDAMAKLPRVICFTVKCV